MAKANKKDVDYSVGMAKSHCGKVFKDDKGYCKFFFYTHDDPLTEENADYINGACEKVKDHISPVYWCKLWEKAE